MKLQTQWACKRNKYGRWWKKYHLVYRENQLWVSLCGEMFLNHPRRFQSVDYDRQCKRCLAMDTE